MCVLGVFRGGARPTLQWLERAALEGPDGIGLAWIDSAAGLVRWRKVRSDPAGLLEAHELAERAALPLVVHTRAAAALQRGMVRLAQPFALEPSAGGSADGSADGSAGGSAGLELEGSARRVLFLVGRIDAPAWALVRRAAQCPERPGPGRSWHGAPEWSDARALALALGRCTDCEGDELVRSCCQHGARRVLVLDGSGRLREWSSENVSRCAAGAVDSISGRI